MAIFLPGKFLHLGTPRCASTATHRALRTLPGIKEFHQHMDLKEMIRYQHGPYRGELAFATVRNPYDVLVTWFIRMHSSIRAMSFLDFVTSYQNKDLERDGRLFFTCVDGVEVMRYETLQVDFDAMLAKIGLEPIQLERHNPTEIKKPWRTYYDEEILAAVNERFGHEFDRYGYERLEP